MEDNYNWNLKDIFKNEEELNIEKQEIRNILEEIKKYKGYYAILLITYIIAIIYMKGH